EDERASLRRAAVRQDQGDEPGARERRGQAKHGEDRSLQDEVSGSGEARSTAPGAFRGAERWVHPTQDRRHLAGGRAAVTLGDLSLFGPPLSEERQHDAVGPPEPVLRRILAAAGSPP